MTEGEGPVINSSSDFHRLFERSVKLSVKVFHFYLQALKVAKSAVK